MAAHTYWRLNVSANAGDVNFLAIAEIEMRATVGGADECTGGTPSASASDGSAPASNAFDNNATTRWSTPSGTLTGWIRYQFASPVDVAQYTIQAHPTTPLRSPMDWALEYSDDGTTWVPVETRQGISSWTNGEIKSYTVVITANARVSQLPVEVIRTNTATKARVSQVTAEVLRINTATKIRASQLAVEVLRPNAAAASASARPVVFVAT